MANTSSVLGSKLLDFSGRKLHARILSPDPQEIDEIPITILVERYIRLRMESLRARHIVFEKYRMGAVRAFKHERLIFRVKLTNLICACWELGIACIKWK